LPVEDSNYSKTPPTQKLLASQTTRVSFALSNIFKTGAVHSNFFKILKAFSYASDQIKG
jgi:hypothetical protein